MSSSSNSTPISAAPESTPSSSLFKLSSKLCGTCNVSFDSVEARRDHSKSPWHVSNVKRRVLGLAPLPVDEFREDTPDLTTSGQRLDEEDFAPDENHEDLDSDSEESVGDVDPEDAPDFVPEQCLFCNQASANFNGNLIHMHNMHGMFIPDKKHLLVDLETLVRYLHLVIFSYNECLSCGKQHRTFEAVQQHMLGKGHCKFDITSEDSEFADFYDRTSITERAGGITEEQKDTNFPHTDSERTSLRLSSGKVLSHRSTPQPHNHRPLPRPNSRERASRLISQDSASSNTETPADQMEKGALTRAEKRDQSFSSQLANISLNDQRSLSHLPASQQRALLATQAKQLDRAKRADRRYQSRVDALGNKTLMKHYVSDVPGRKNG